MKSVALHLIATNKYTYFLEKICETANTHFFPDCDRHIIIYTNLEFPTFLENKYPSIKFHYKKIVHEPWPYVTLKRFHYFSENEIIHVDYDFYCDVDARFIKTLTENNLPVLDFLFTVHPLWKPGYDPTEKNINSTAFISKNCCEIYICGGFFGGKHNDFIKMSKTIKNNIDIDLKNSIVAINNDESHMNKFYSLNRIQSSLNERPFAVAEGYEIPKENSYIFFIEKGNIGGHNYFRNT